MPPNVVIVVFTLFLLILFLPGTQRGQISCTLDETQKGLVQAIIQLFFPLLIFTPFKPSLFIGPLYRPCLLFFTPFTPLSLGCLPLHFMPTSITLHWSKWSGPSSVYTALPFKCITFFRLQPQTVLLHPKMCLWKGRLSRRNFRSKRPSACECTSLRLHLFLL